MNSRLLAIILGAGKGSRLGEGPPKVLRSVCGKPMVDYVVGALNQAQIEHKSIVISKNKEDFESLIQRYPDISFCIQEEQNGTAGAVASCANLFESGKKVSYASLLDAYHLKTLDYEYALVLAGDTPGIDGGILKKFVETSVSKGSDVAVLAMDMEDPKGYGRLVLDQNKNLEKIVEEKDATAWERKITICNSGILLFKVSRLFELLERVQNKNAQNEFYLTDCILLAVEKEMKVSVYEVNYNEGFQGINTKEQLQSVEKYITKSRCF